MLCSTHTLAICYCKQFIDAGVVEFALFDAEAPAPHSTDSTNSTNNARSSRSNSNAHNSHHSHSSDVHNSSSNLAHGSSSASTTATATAAAAAAAASDIDYHTLELQLSDTRLDLRSSSSTTTTSSSTNSSHHQKQHHPLLVPCNYVCDTLVQDAFRVQNGRLYENRVTVSSYSSPITSMDGVDVSTRIRMSIS
jgi:hypothetical protein